MEFEIIKLLLLLKHLEAVPGSELHLLIIEAANSAAGVARATPYPGLVFPCLFAERAEIILEEEKIRSRNYWATLHGAPQSGVNGVQWDNEMTEPHHADGEVALAQRRFS